MFSATTTPKLDEMSKRLLTDPVKIVVGKENSVNEDIIQNAVVLETRVQKIEWIQKNIGQMLQQGQILVFVNSAEAADEIKADL